MASTAPHPTLYIKNIDWKIKKGLLRRALYALFSRHGKVLEIVALRKEGLRGQAFVIMADTAAATAALLAENGFTFFGKDLVIEYARSKSTRIARLDGSLKSKQAKKDRKERQYEEDEKMEDSDNDVARESDKEEEKAEAKKEEDKKEEETLAADESDKEVTNATPTAIDAPKEETVEEGLKGKDTEKEPEVAPTVAADDMVEDGTSPSKILVVTGLPTYKTTRTAKTAVSKVFKDQTGFQECRIPRENVAYVEFDEEANAAAALEALQGHPIRKGVPLELAYATEES